MRSVEELTIWPFSDVIRLLSMIILETICDKQLIKYASDGIWRIFQNIAKKSTLKGTRLYVFVTNDEYVNKKDNIESHV